MRQRCPTARYLGLARLSGYRWIINDRGYANVVEDSSDEKASSNEVWGLVYLLQPDDERKLDVNEGVPFAYTKEELLVDFWPAPNASSPDRNPEVPNASEKPQKAEMLVYIDRKRTADDKPKSEYIYRMNMGLKDALKEGMPKTYLDEVMRKFIPDLEDEAVAKVAEKQALLFEDEK